MGSLRQPWLNSKNGVRNYDFYWDGCRLPSEHTREFLWIYTLSSRFVGLPYISCFWYNHVLLTTCIVSVGHTLLSSYLSGIITIASILLLIVKNCHLILLFQVTVIFITVKEPNITISPGCERRTPSVMKTMLLPVHSYPINQFSHRTWLASVCSSFL